MNFDNISVSLKMPEQMPDHIDFEVEYIEACNQAENERIFFKTPQKCLTLGDITHHFEEKKLLLNSQKAPQRKASSRSTDMDLSFEINEDLNLSQNQDSSFESFTSKRKRPNSENNIAQSNLRKDVKMKSILRAMKRFYIEEFNEATKFRSLKNKKLPQLYSECMNQYLAKNFGEIVGESLAE